MDMTALIEAKRAERANTGLNVEFRRPDGTWDCWSFRTAKRAEAFKRAKAAEGVEVRDA